LRVLSSAAKDHLTVMLLSREMETQMVAVRLAEGVLGLSHLPLRRV